MISLAKLAAAFSENTTSSPGASVGSQIGSHPAPATTSSRQPTTPKTTAIGQPRPLPPQRPAPAAAQNPGTARSATPPVAPPNTVIRSAPTVPNPIVPPSQSVMKSAGSWADAGLATAGGLGLAGGAAGAGALTGLGLYGLNRLTGPDGVDDEQWRKTRNRNMLTGAGVGLGIGASRLLGHLLQSRSASPDAAATKAAAAGGITIQAIKQALNYRAGGRKGKKIMPQPHTIQTRRATGPV